jgi:hypothetical protein
MATIGRLAVKIDADTAGLTTGLSQADGKVKAFEGRIGAMSDSMSLATAAAGALGVALAGGGLLSKLVTVQREFDVLNASMITMTGSAAAAQKEFAWLKDFAATTPFALNEVVGAFVKMQALGLEPTQAALESFGNTASAMGKSLNQMIEAVADASTGEFERLKEFGIKAKKEGDNVSLTFQGVTTTIRNSSAEITGYLEGLGKNEFAGAMAERAKTLDGAISNLSDTWDELFRTVNEANAGGLIYDSVKLATGAMEQAIKIIEAMSSSAAENGRQTGAMATVLDGVGKVFETIAVLGVNVSYVFKTIGRDLGGMAAQAAALATFDFKGFASIGRAMAEDAKEGRAEVDRLTAAILNARNTASAAAPTGSVGSGDTALRRAEAAAGGGSTGGGSTGGGVGGGKATGGSKAKEKSIFDNGDPVQQELQDRLDKVDSGDAAIRRQEERDKNYAAELADFERRAQALKDYHKTEEELKLEKHEKELEQLALDRENGFLTEQEYMLAEQDMAMKHMDELARIRDEGEKRITTLAEMSWSERAAFASKHMTDMTKDLAGQSKAAFNVHKAAAIATALINAKTSISSAYQHGTKMGGPKVGMAFAAVAAIQTAAQINAIKSQQFGGGGTSGAGGGGGGAVSGRETGGASQAPGMQQTITIQGIGAGDIFGGESVRLLIDKLIDAQRNGAKILLA